MPSLLLHARDPYWSPHGLTGLIDAMRNLGLIAGPCAEEQSGVYRAGESFLSLVMFLGCSPQVQLDPNTAADGQAVCSIRFHVHPDVIFLSAAKRPAPRCRQCRTPVSDSENISPESSISCGQCHKTSVATELDWRQVAGFGRCFVEIAGIYPHEAVPSDKLLNALANCSGGSWVYFYR